MHPKGREGHFGVARAAKQLLSPDTRIGFLQEQKADFFVKLEVPQRQQFASERTSLTLFAPAPSSISFVPLTRNLSLADPSPYPVRWRTGLSEATATRFSVLRKGREGAAACPGVPENASRTTEGCSAHRISAPYQRRGFPVPNIAPVPEKPVFYTECR